MGFLQEWEKDRTYAAWQLHRVQGDAVLAWARLTDKKKKKTSFIGGIYGGKWKRGSCVASEYLYL